ncbi:MAG TPA: alpha/beta hydrolase, partial [Nitrososphaerales archaeon]|nr:alpha/beta hydrolase [Nitrososphaerales archaeon]
IINILGMEPTVQGMGENARHTGIPNFSKTNLPERFQLIGYNTYSRAGGPEFATIAESKGDIDRVASECFVLLQHLNLTKVHVFAHHQVGYVALKLALDHPDLVKTITLQNFEIVNHFTLNPKMQSAIATSMQRAQNNPQYQERMQMLRQMMEAAKTGTIDGESVDPAIAAQLNSIPQSYLSPGADPGDPLSMTVKTWSAQMLSTDYEEVGSRIKQPLLAVIFADGPPWTRQSADLLKNWLPQAEIYTVPKKAHWFSGQNDQGLAQGLVDFYSRYRLSQFT